MATSLLQALLEHTHGFTDDDYQRLSNVTKRLLRNELYEMLNRDPVIMPLLVQAIIQNSTNTTRALFEELAQKIGQDYEQLSQSS